MWVFFLYVSDNCISHVFSILYLHNTGLSAPPVGIHCDIMYFARLTAHFFLRKQRKLHSQILTSQWIPTCKLTLWYAGRILNRLFLCINQKSFVSNVINLAPHHHYHHYVQCLELLFCLILHFNPNCTYSLVKLSSDLEWPL